jgi:rubrerythrin
MKEFESIEDVLDFAIEREQEAADFYEKLAANAKDKVMRETFEQYSKEEKGHKARLEKIKSGGEYTLKSGDTMDLKIGDYLICGYWLNGTPKLRKITSVHGGAYACVTLDGRRVCPIKKYYKYLIYDNLEDAVKILEYILKAKQPLLDLKNKIKDIRYEKGINRAIAIKLKNEAENMYIKHLENIGAVI